MDVWNVKKPLNFLMSWCQWWRCGKGGKNTMARRKDFGQKQIQASWWDPNEVVIIRSLAEEDAEAIQDRLMELSQLPEAGKQQQPPEARMLLGSARRLTLLYGIQSWTFTDKNNKPLPLSEESIRRLAPEDGEFIYNAINAMNQPMSESQKKS
jgi:hypothetical protein